jgi:arylsulfatase A-like enzyme
MAGAQVWIWFALMEFIFATGLRVIGHDHAILTHQQWCGNALLFGCYAAVGIAVGAAAAVVGLRRPELTRMMLRLLPITPVALFVLNAAWAHGLSVERWAVTLAAVICGVAIVRERPLWRFELGGTGRAILAALALNFAAWMPSSGIPRLSGRVLLAVLPASIVLLLVLGSFVARLTVPFRRLAGTAFLPAPVGAIVAALLVISGVAVASSRAQRRPTDGNKRAASAIGRPNVLLIVLDSVRADHLGIYGYSRDTTPKLRDLAAHSTLYSGLMAASPYTLPAHASLFSGLYPQAHGAFHSVPDFPHERPLPDGCTTLASALGSAGYQTMAVMANRYYLRPEFGLTRGFDYADWQQPVEVLHLARPFYLRMGIWRLFLHLRVLHPFAEGAITRALAARTLTADEVNSRAYALLSHISPGGSPFFLFLNYMDAHVPFLPPPPYDRMFRNSDDSFPMLWYERAADVGPKNTPIEPVVRDYLVSQYDGAIAYLDERISELLAYLKRNGLYDRTLVMITSDHGEALGEKNIVGHGSSVYQDQIQVPLVIKYPSQDQPRQIDAVLSQVDLMPTILETAGVPVPAGIQGASLLKGGSEDRPVISEFHGVADQGPRFYCCKFAIFSRSQKLIYYTSGAPELYDWRVDPGERHNLYQPGLSAAAQLQEELTRWSARTVPRYVSKTQANKKAIERLKSLGYAGQK